jgi:hypothetical protein
VLIAWPSGKDSAWALHVIRRAGEYDVVGALRGFNSRSVILRGSPLRGSHLRVTVREKCR